MWTHSNNIKALDNTNNSVYGTISVLFLFSKLIREKVDQGAF